MDSVKINLVVAEIIALLKAARDRDTAALEIAMVTDMPTVTRNRPCVWVEVPGESPEKGDGLVQSSWESQLVVTVEIANMGLDDQGEYGLPAETRQRTHEVAYELWRRGGTVASAKLRLEGIRYAYEEERGGSAKYIGKGIITYRVVYEENQT